MAERGERYWFDVGTVVVGAAVLVSALVLDVTAAGGLGLVVFGILVLAGGIAKLRRPDLIDVDVAVVGIGLWFLIAPWVTVAGTPTAEWVLVGLGVAMMLVALPGAIARYNWIDAPYPHHSAEEPAAVDEERDRATTA